MKPHLRLPTSPLADPEAVVQGDRWRITVLADGLLRLEWSDDGVFEDRASTFAIHRDLPVPDFDVVDGEGAIEIVTDRLRLTYDRGPFSAAGLSVQVRGNVSNYHSVWRYGEPTRSNLGGTARTLDEVDGRTELEPGIVSRIGVAALDDSRSFLFTDDGWVAPRDGGGLDLYVFAYGHDYDEALQAFFAVSGRPPVLPRWALGNWWSRYHRYSADSYLELLDRFEAEGLPFSVGVLDMDWHRVDSVPERYGSGWTGYSWEPRAVPRPRGLPRRGAPARHARDAQRPPRRRRARLRGRLPAHGRGARARPGHRRADRLRHHRPRVPRGLPRGRPPPARGAGRRLLVARLAAGHLLAHRRHRPAVDAQPLPLPRLGPRRPAAADLLALRRARAATATRSASPATRTSRGSRWSSSPSSPRPRRTSATAGGATTSAATSAASATTS